MKRGEYIKSVYILYDNDLGVWKRCFRSFMTAVRNCKEYESIGVFKEYSSHREFVKFIDVRWVNGLPMFKVYNYVSFK